MYKTLENVRNKPDHHKHMIALTASLVFTAVIVLFWFSVVRVGYTTEASKAAIGDSPFKVFKDSVVSTYNGIKSDLGKIEYRAE
jgi:hypothetical protein